jgi:hypothetical protein
MNIRGMTGRVRSFTWAALLLLPILVAACSSGGSSSY